MDPMLLILIFGAGAVVVLLVIGIVVTARSERSLVDERLGRKTGKGFYRYSPEGKRLPWEKK